MMSGPPRTSSGSGRGRPRTGTIVLIAVLAVALFGAGVGIALLLRGGTTTASPTTPSSAACVTTTVRPGVVLPKPGTVTVNVYNATKTSGLAKRTAQTLTARGFLVSKVANDPLSKTVTGVAELRHGPKGLQNATLLRYYVPGAVLVADARTDATVDVVIGDGFTAIATPAAVQAALNKPVTVQTGPGCTPKATATP